MAWVMTTAADLARQLKAKRTGPGAWLAKCPAHDDRRESLSIGEGEDGRLLLNCFAGCDFADILKAAGVEPTNPNGEDRSGKPRIVATYDYRDVHGELVFQVARLAPKSFRQRRPDGNGGWIWGRGEAPPLPYRLPELIEASEVYIVEGEKDCDNLAKVGIVATSNPGGADKDGEGGKKWPAGFARYFDGRHAILIPDNDTAGRRHVQAVAKKIAGKAASIRILELPGLPEKGDVSDWIDAGGTAEELQAMAAALPDWDGVNEPPSYTLLADLKPNLRSNEVVGGLIPRRAFGAVTAASSGGKTAILVDLLLHVAAGLIYRGRRVEQQVVIYVALEGHGGIDNRVIAAAQEIGIEDAPFALVKSTDNFKDQAAAEHVAKIANELMARFGGDNPIIMIDTFTAALGGGASDCDPKDVSAFIAHVHKHLLAIGTTLLAHHFGKDERRGGRGWSGLLAALDFELEIHKADDGLRTMLITKNRDGSDQQPVCCYRFHSRELGRNEHDEPVTAVVVEHLADENITRPRGLSQKARAALDQLWACIKDPVRSFPMPQEPGLRCVLLEEWEKACTAPDVISTAAEERDRRKQFRKAKAELEHAGAVICDGEAGNRVRPAPKSVGSERENGNA
jgi:hypothetical protein